MTNNKLTINPKNLVPMNYFKGHFPIDIDLVYAQPGHKDNKFPRLYDPNSTILWAHKDIAKVILLASKICAQNFGWRLKLNDCLRPIEAQAAMEKYGYHPELVSLPGTGAHPRAMAIDIEPIDKGGNLVEMGTRFDHFVDDPTKDENPAARSYLKFIPVFNENTTIYMNRKLLECAMSAAAEILGQEIYPLPQEWWDFREPNHISNQFKPLSERDLFSWQRLIEVDIEGIQGILNGDIPKDIQPAIREVEASIGGNPSAFLKKIKGKPACKR